MNIEFCKQQCKNKIFLLALFIILSILVSAIIYYTKNEEDRNKETNQELAVRAFIPAVFLAFIVVIGIYFIDFPKRENTLLQEDFWD